MRIGYFLFIILYFVSFAQTMAGSCIVKPDSITPDTIRTKTLTNYIIRCDTLQTDTIITYHIYKDTVMVVDTSVKVINFLGSRTRDTVTTVTKVVKPTFWKIGGNGMLHFSQTHLSYWVEGGESTISSLSGLSLFAGYKKKMVSWDNFMQFKYGQMKSGKREFRKNEDKFEMNTKFGHVAFKNLYYSILADLKSQLFRGYDYPNDTTRTIVSDFLSPGYLVIAIGMDYKPSDKLSVLLSPLTSKMTYIGDTINVDPLKFGLEDGKKLKKELGAYFKMQYKIDLTKNIMLENKLDLFSNYLEDPQNVDINWEAYLVMKINKYISTNISTHLIYDDNIDIPVYEDDGSPVLNEDGDQVTTKHAQFKEILSIGFSYKF